MKKLTILIDMDDTIENLTTEWVKYLNEKHGLNKTRDDLKEWDMTKAFPMLTPSQVYEPLFEMALWERVVPLPGAVENVKKLIDDGHFVYIVTSSHIATLEMKTRLVLNRYFPFLKWDNVIVASEKGMIDGDVIVDDNPDNLHGRRLFKFLMDAPHNRSYNTDPFTIRVSNWDEIYKKICICCGKFERS